MTSRPFPDWWIRQSAVRKELLEQSVQALRADSQLRAMAEAYLIFGSFARGDVGPESDLDIIAIQNSDAEFSMRGLDIRKRLSKLLPVQFDLIVYTSEEFARLSADNAFVRAARAEGIWFDATSSA